MAWTPGFRWTFDHAWSVSQAAMWLLGSSAMLVVARWLHWQHSVNDFTVIPGVLLAMAPLQTRIFARLPRFFGPPAMPLLPWGATHIGLAVMTWGVVADHWYLDRMLSLPRGVWEELSWLTTGTLAVVGLVSYTCGASALVDRVIFREMYRGTPWGATLQRVAPLIACCVMGSCALASVSQ